ncbi:unnamed protein product [Didymodactylos carnosus]|uniref:Phosphatidylinositol transfer protein N-terminal domain-containing protein n=1 Tax=Didymodactylos carnosus TaxID=1234261 RepID=A0A814HFC1_9BILA|nr:unnamed protein product [Didymodactylos carnosus]CAF1008892.1 unnamed protein product [Didymodactylos carnosus]CAF3551044.1 unnamed protein product [Didymodactylos carnosus]CAF3781033.1 unnamed protein product [Didymodactylos carnosus]
MAHSHKHSHAQGRIPGPTPEQMAKVHDDHITEFRIVLPLTVEEYQLAQLWSTAECSKQNTGGGEGVEVIKNEPFEKPMSAAFLEKFNKGQYTHKIYHLRDRVPGFVKALVSSPDAFDLHEEAHNAYPYCKTVLTSAYMKDAMYIDISTLHLPHVYDSRTDCFQDNVHQLGKKDYDRRKIVVINIADPVSANDYKPKEDPTKFKSIKTGRGPLIGEWQKNCQPLMCCYKLVRVHFKWFGIGTRVQDFIMKQEQRLFRNFHRQLFCWMDEWYGLTMNDIRELEERTKEELKNQLVRGEKQGFSAEE